jgi:hypothetical protein
VDGAGSEPFASEFDFGISLLSPSELSDGTALMVSDERDDARR